MVPEASEPSDRVGPSSSFEVSIGSCYGALHSYIKTHSMVIHTHAYQVFEYMQEAYVPSPKKKKKKKKKIQGA